MGRENAATVAAVWGVGFLLAPLTSRPSIWLGASLLGMSVLFRIQMGVFVNNGFPGSFWMDAWNCGTASSGCPFL